MKSLMPIIAAIALLFFFVPATQAQTASSKVIDLYWQTAGLDVDTQYFQIYVGDSDTTLQPFGDPIPFNPNDPNAPEQVTSQYTLEITEGQEVTKWFSVSSIDTSGNECKPGDLRTICADKLPDIVSVTIDMLPPAPPGGLTVTIRVIPVTQ